MDTALRTLKRKNKGIKLADEKVISGRGRLTDFIIDSMQNYYGRNNDDILSMENAI